MAVTRNEFQKSAGILTTLHQILRLAHLATEKPDDERFVKTLKHGGTGDTEKEGV